MELFDEIRAFVISNYFKPAMARSETSIVLVSGEVHSRMNLTNRMPAVCNALRSDKPWGRYNVRLAKEIRLPGVQLDSSTNKFAKKHLF
jgi:hypothetical protein